jgi:hypothetical protein
MNPAAEKFKDKWDTIIAPDDKLTENVFAHSLLHDDEGMVYAGVYNEKLGLGISTCFAYDSLDYLIEWKCMKSGDYVLGLMPANNHASGRAFERTCKTIKTIKPFEQKKAGMVITIIDGKDDLAEFKKKFSRCTKRN